MPRSGGFPDSSSCRIVSGDIGQGARLDEGVVTSGMFCSPPPMPGTCGPPATSQFSQSPSSVEGFGPYAFDMGFILGGADVSCATPREASYCGPVVGSSGRATGVIVDDALGAVDVRPFIEFSASRPLSAIFQGISPAVNDSSLWTWPQVSPK